MIEKIAFVAHPVRNIRETGRFYGDILGLEHWADYGRGRWSEFRTPDDMTIALDGHSPGKSDSPVPYLALETDDIEAEVARLKEHGVIIARDVWTNRDEDDREVCRMAIVLDPEGHALMLHQTAAWRRA